VIGNEREGYFKEICCIVRFIYLFILFSFVFLFAPKYRFFFFVCDVKDYNSLFFHFLMCKWLLEDSCNTMESGYNGS